MAELVRRGNSRPRRALPHAQHGHRLHADRPVHGRRRKRSRPCRRRTSSASCRRAQPDGPAVVVHPARKLTLAVNLLAPLGERYRPEALPRRCSAAERWVIGSCASMRRTSGLCAWIDWQFAPSWWSSEVRDRFGLVRAGRGRFDRRLRRLRFARSRRTTGCTRTANGPMSVVFGPYGVAEAHRKTGLGPGVARRGAVRAWPNAIRWALIPAVSGERLIASYEERADAHVADSYDYALRPARAVILASGSGTNAQAVIDDVQPATARSRSRR